MMEGMKRRGGGGLAYPAFSVDVASLCGPPHTDTPANESNLVSTSQKNSVSTSLCSPEQSTPPLIFQHPFYLNANTAQHDFCQGGCEREILGKMERRKVKGGETDKKTVRKTLCSQDCNLSGVIVPLVEELLSLCRPAGHQRKYLISKPMYTQQRHLESNTGKPVSMIAFQPDAVLV